MARLSGRWHRLPWCWGDCGVPVACGYAATREALGSPWCSLPPSPLRFDLFPALLLRQQASFAVRLDGSGLEEKAAKENISLDLHFALGWNSIAA
jgi:hypothetical protein